MSLPLPPDPYKALGVDPKADAATIKTAYKKLVLKCHPDKFPDEKLKAIKQDEFQRVQQAYEILGDDDKRQDYDLDVKAKRLREELMKQRSTSSSNGTPRKYAHVNIRTAEPTGAAYAAAPQPPQSSKGSYSPYSGGAPFAHSWEQQAGRHSRTTSDDHRPHRARSYEKDERESRESRESRRRRDDEERARIDKENARERRRKEKAAEAEAAHSAAVREDERRARKERRRQEEELLAQQEKERAKKRTDRERADKKERQDRLRRRESEDKRTKSRSYEPYVENLTEEDEEIRRSSARKSSSKKRSNEPIREKSTGRADRDQPLHESPKATTPLAGKLKEDLDIDIAKAEGYMASMRRNSSKATPLTTQYTSDAYPDPDVAWHPPAHVTGSSRRHSGEGRHSKGEPVVINSEPYPSSKLDSRPSITPLKKASTFAEPKMGRSATSARMPMPGHLQRAQTMQPEFIGRSSDPVPSSSDRHPYKSSRQRKFSGNIDVEELSDESEIEELINKSANANISKASANLSARPRMPTSHSYRVQTDDDGMPRTSTKSTSTLRREESAYGGGGGGGGFESSSNPFPKVKTAAKPQQVFRSPSYAAEDVYYASYDSHGHGGHGGRSYKVPVR